MSMSPGGFGWEPDTSPRPGVVVWFRVYAAVMAVVYGLVSALGAAMLVRPDIFIDPAAGLDSNRPADPAEAAIMGAIYLGLGMILLAAFLVSFVLPRGKGAWIYDLVLICLGMTSCCCLPATIPLLIFWLKPETKGWFYG